MKVNSKRRHHSVVVLDYASQITVWDIKYILSQGCKTNFK